MPIHFESLTLFGCPPVGNRHFIFSKGVNFVVGEWGTGKTSVAQALRTGTWPFGGSVEVDPPNASALMDKHWALSFVDPNFSHYIGDVGATDHWINHCIGQPKLLKRIGVLLSQMVSGKLGVNVTKFHSIPYVGEETFEIEILPNGLVEVHAGSALKAVEHYSPYGNIEELFHASSERFLIAFAGLLAVREYRQLNSPIIFDSIFDRLEDFRVTVINVVRRLECQVLILERPTTMEYLERLNLVESSDVLLNL